MMQPLGLMHSIIATTAVESTPAEGNTPSGTSEISRKRTAKRGQAYPRSVKTMIYELDPIHRARRFGNGDVIRKMRL
jgi:hypothetical protein